LESSSDDCGSAAVAFINCEARFTMDEGVEVFYDSVGVSWIRGAIYDPLHTPPDFVDPEIPHHEPGTDHGYGHLVGGLSDLSLVQQSLYAHTTDRNPLVAAPNHAHINVLHYDHGRPDIGRGEGLNVSDNGGHNEEDGRTMQCNLVGSVAVRGPSCGTTICFARVRGVTAGSTGHAAHNGVFGWPSPPDQQTFFESAPEGYSQPTVRRTAWPNGLGANYAGVLLPFADPLAPTKQEGLAFAQLIRCTVGCKPAKRYLYAGGVNAVMDQIDAAIRGIEAPGQWADTVEEAGGWPAMPHVEIDPEKPGDEYHAPLPLGADRDELLLSGTFSDGSSRIGYSKLRAWMIEQYFYVIGR
jgi:hypothetical protein